MSSCDYSSETRPTISVSKENSSKTSRGSSTDDADEEEQEESSSSSSSLWESNLNKEKEMKLMREDGTDVNKNVNSGLNNCTLVEEEATKWFQLGVEMEQKGKLVEAIGFYKKAVQLVPDIEFKFYNAAKSVQNDNDEVTSDTNDSDCGENSEHESDDENDNLDLISKFQKYFSKQSLLCIMKYNQTQTHVSALPVEVILYILRWVVSSELDLRSLEMFSRVCRGFYLCTRDSEIWRLACLRVWGENCKLVKFNSWREMYIHRPRLNFNGCYISRTTYIRNGERNFQDCFYRPWFEVIYFRYLRFFPDGTVLMLNTPEEPVPSITMLKYRKVSSPSVLTGTYCLNDDRVSLVLKHHSGTSHKSNLYTRYKGRRIKDQSEKVEPTFHIELQSVSYKSKANAQLVWIRYSASYKYGNSETCNCFEIVRSKFPPLTFSRVKSWPAECYGPLM